MRARMSVLLSGRNVNGKTLGITVLDSGEWIFGVRLRFESNVCEEIVILHYLFIMYIRASRVQRNLYYTYANCSYAIISSYSFVNQLVYRSI